MREIIVVVANGLPGNLIPSQQVAKEDADIDDDVVCFLARDLAADHR